MKQFRNFRVLLVVAAVVSLVSSGKAEASFEKGLSLGLGTGIISPSDDGRYKGDDLYPEAQLAYDTGALKFGLHVGYIYRAERIGHLGAGFDLIGEEMIFVPVEFDLCYMPLRTVGHGRTAFQPYVGIGVGKMIATGDNDRDVSIAPVIRAGISFYAGDWNIIGIDLAHHIAKEGGHDYSYTTLMLEYRFRIPFVRRHQHGDTSNMQRNDGTDNPRDSSNQAL